MLYLDLAAGSQVIEPLPRVSVIILTFNARLYVEQCLAAVFNQDYPQLDVIVVDNASTDGTPKLVRERFPQARLIVSPTNSGYGGGNNLGAAQACGDILVFLNPDALPEPGWLRRLVDGMRQDGRQLATSRIILQAHPERLNTSGLVIHYLGLAFCRGLNMHRSSFEAAELVTGVSGAALAIARPLFERLGGFDGSFFLYHDDVDLSVRALLAGERCLYVPDSVVAHDYNLAVSPMKWGWVEAHRYSVLLKTYRLRTLLVLLPALLTLDLMIFAYLAVQGPAFVLAKLRSYGWVVRHVAAIRDRRRRAQAIRAISDRQILAVLTDRIPYEQLAPRWLAQLAAGLVDPWFRLYRRASLLIVTW